MKLPGIVLAGIETAFNRVISDQPEAFNPKLNGHMICIDLFGLDSQIFFYFIDSRLAVLDETDKHPDAIIKGTPVALALVGLGKQGSTRDIELSGDLQLAQAFEALLKNIEFDWEETLSKFTGDIVAFRVGEVARSIDQWARQSGQAFADDLRDYLQIETRHLPLPEEVDAFNRSVDDIRAATERFGLRVQRLQDRLAVNEEWVE